MRLEQHDIVTLDEAESVDSLTKKLGDLLVNQKLRLTTAESCTGGKLASALCAHALFIFRQFNPINLTGCHQKCRIHFQAVVRQCRTTVSA